MFQRILVPLDGSLLAEKALASVREVGQKFDSEIILLRVAAEVHPTLIGETHLENGYVYHELLRSIHAQEIAEARAYLADVKRRLRADGLVVKTQLQTKLLPAEAILAAVKAHEVDVIVMSTHGRGGVSRWVYGSVADKVLRSCDVPILLIRANTGFDAFSLPLIESEEDLVSHEVVGG